MFYVSVWLQIIGALVTVYEEIHEGQCIETFKEIRISYPESYSSNESLYDEEMYAEEIDHNRNSGQSEAGKDLAPEAHYRTDVKSTPKESYQISLSTTPEAKRKNSPPKADSPNDENSKPEVSYQTNQCATLEQGNENLAQKVTCQTSLSAARLEQVDENPLAPTPEVQNQMNENPTAKKSNQMHQSLASEQDRVRGNYNLPKLVPGPDFWLNKNLTPKINHQVGGSATGEQGHGIGNDKLKLGSDYQVNEYFTPGLSYQIEEKSITEQDIWEVNDSLKLIPDYHINENFTTEMSYQTRRYATPEQNYVEVKDNLSSGLSHPANENFTPTRNSKLNQSAAQECNDESMNESAKLGADYQKNKNFTSEMSYHSSYDTSPEPNHPETNDYNKLELDYQMNENPTSELNFDKHQNFAAIQDEVTKNDNFTLELNYQVDESSSSGMIDQVTLNTSLLRDRAETIDNLGQEWSHVETNDNLRLKLDDQKSQNASLIRNHEETNNNLTLESDYQGKADTTPGLNYYINQNASLIQDHEDTDNKLKLGLDYRVNENSTPKIDHEMSEFTAPIRGPEKNNDNLKLEQEYEMVEVSTAGLDHQISQNASLTKDHGKTNNSFELELNYQEDENPTSELNHVMGQDIAPIRDHEKKNDYLKLEPEYPVNDHSTSGLNHEMSQNDSLIQNPDKTSDNLGLGDEYQVNENPIPGLNYEQRNVNFNLELDYQTDKNSSPELKHQMRELSRIEPNLETSLYADDTEPDDETDETPDLETSKIPHKSRSQEGDSRRKQHHMRPSHEDITGGRPTQISDYPFLAILRVFRDESLRQGPVYCTSSILTANWILTAAHCIGKLKDPKRVEVIAGQTNIRHADRWRTQERKAARLVVHQNYFRSSSPGNGDLALVKVEKPFLLNGKSVSSIKLRGGEWFVPSRKTNCTSVGWGRQRFNDRSMGPLYSITSVATHGDDYCPCVSSGKKPRVVCLEKSQGYGICKGDSGGPLICDGEVVGVAHVLYPTPFLCISALSGRPECGVSGWMDIYMYTCPYLNWIRENVGDSVPAQPLSCSAAKPNHSNAIAIVGAALGALLRSILSGF